MRIVIGNVRGGVGALSHDEKVRFDRELGNKCYELGLGVVTVEFVNDSEPQLGLEALAWHRSLEGIYWADDDEDRWTITNVGRETWRLCKSGRFMDNYDTLADAKHGAEGFR